MQSFSEFPSKFAPWIAALVLAPVGGCGTYSAIDLAARSNMIVQEVEGAGFGHTTMQRWASPPGTRLHIYIEGDGIPWVGNLPSADPTPRNALAFKLATIDPNDVVYVGRPCYFEHADDDGCDPKYWTSYRYGDEVLRSMVRAIGRVRQPRHSSIVLIGHSGGGALAALLESRVDDVVGVITIGANLDIDKWTELHNYDSLSGSLNPIRQAKDAGIPHLQLAGGRDDTVPLVTSSDYARLKPNVKLVVYQDFDHVCCWEREWPGILDEFSAATAKPRVK